LAPLKRHANTAIKRQASEKNKDKRLMKIESKMFEINQSKKLWL